MTKITDSYSAEIQTRRNRRGDFFIEIFEFTDEGIDPLLRFLVMAHRGYPTFFHLSLSGQAGTAVAAIAMCRRKVRDLTGEEIQVTPEGKWHRAA